MHKFIILNTLWAKIVNNLRTAGGLISVYPSTLRPFGLNTNIGYGAQVDFTNNSLPHNSTNLYTYLNSIFTLLNTSFTHYPQPLLMSPAKEN